jgi:hypothetical protein
MRSARPDPYLPSWIPRTSAVRPFPGERRVVSDKRQAGLELVVVRCFGDAARVRASHDGAPELPAGAEGDRLRRRAARVSAWLDEWDFIGVYVDDYGPPPGEYDCLVWPLLRLLQENVSDSRIGGFLQRELRRHFGIGDDQDLPAVAARLRSWWQREGEHGPSPVPLGEPPAPELAAALVQMNLIDLRQRPWLAADWLARGHDGPRLRELAGLRGHEPEVTDLWPAALAELDVPTPLPQARRLAAVWAAQQVCTGQQDPSWFAPAVTSSTGRQDDVVDDVAIGVDHLLDVASHLDDEATCLRAPRLPWRRARADTVQRQADDLRARLVVVLETVAAGRLHRARALLHPAGAHPEA